MATKELIVDDGTDIVELVPSRAAQAMFECLEPCDGVRALRLVRETRSDVVILDLMLPGLDGLQVCRRLRQDRANPRRLHGSAVPDQARRVQRSVV